MDALRSPATAAKYRRELARFRAAVPQPLHAVTFGDLHRYVESRTGLRAPASQALAVAILRSFFRFCLRLGYLPLNPADLLEPPRVPCTSDLRWCLPDELAAILAAADRLNPTAGLLCAVLALTGLRIAEAAGIRWSAFLRDPHGNVGLRVIGKGGKERTLKVRPDLWRRITAARRARGLSEEPGSGGNEPLFPNRWGRPCSVTYLRRLVGQAARAAGVAKPVSPHWFRHSHATLALAGGASLLQVQRDLGHASLAVTQRYLHLAQGLREGSADFVRVTLPGE